MTSDTPKPHIYSDYCHSLSPTIGKWCPLRAIDVHRLERLGMYVDGVEIYHHGNHPVKWVRLTGVIVAVDSYPERVIYTLDDSSGMCILCVCPAPVGSSTEVANPPAPANHIKLQSKDSTASKPVLSKSSSPAVPSVAAPRVPWDEVDVGVVVKIKGRVGRYREEMKVDVVKVEVVRSTEMEVRCWDDGMVFRRDVLGRPWVVSEVEEERCRKRAVRQRGGREEKDKRRRVERRAKAKEVEKGKGIVKDATGKEKERRELNREEEEERWKRQEGERERQKGEEREVERQKRENQAERKREEDTDGLDPRNKVNYPSLAVRRMLAGKYDALGI